MRFLTRRADRLTPYTAGEQPKDRSYIKLNTNENPYPPSPAVHAEIARAAERLRLYPDPLSGELREAIGAVEGLDPSCVFCGNGSDEVLSLSFYAFFDDDRPLLFPDVTYSFYPVYASYYGLPTSRIPLNERFEIAVEDYLRPASGVIFPNPNAPTGIELGQDAIRRLLEYHRDRVVAVDEAYVAFGAQSAARLIADYPNLLVLRTFSKSHSLAGLRVGYALGQPHLIEGLVRVKDSFNSYPVDRLAEAAARAAILDTAYYTEINAKVAATRNRFSERLSALGFTVLPSKANFVFASPPQAEARDLFRQLRERGILVRHFDLPRIGSFLRITIGTDEDMDRLAEVLTELTP
ncbi:histidinol-phosphate transaminase [Gorillibacterium sp. sgz500922]|uniref:histidinol-phosphate transaminase n=1 Tax=Gorillibacterium sp. sgz500922 TaxID=3446694 RepID=UPI003F6801C3